MVATLSQSSIMMYASAAGFPNPPLMAAIAMAESSGRTDVVNSIGCVGLWQINQPAWAPSEPQWSVAWLQDPMHNAQAAKIVYDQQGLGAWETYTNGSYKQYLTAGASSTGASNASWYQWLDPFGLIPGDSGSPGNPAIPYSGTPGAPGPNIGGTLDSAATLADRVGAASSWLGNPHNWLRVTYVLVGGLVALVGIGGILRPVWQPAAAGAAKVATKVTPVGRAATVAKGAAKAAGKGAK